MVGGGSLPGGALPTKLAAISIKGKKNAAFVLKLSQALRNYTTPIIGRISDNALLLDPRSVLPEEDEIVVKALKEITEIAYLILSRVGERNLFVLGTAGHVDHGKSALVQALTGIDPDRLAQEKERGMTIDLGFAWLKLPSGQEIGIVDVPGHERFVRNMLAGAGGIDIAMLVIAANEGVMPQTREHLAILDLLGISKGVVALTKRDLVDKEWLDLVRLDIEELLKPTTLSGAPIVPVSAITREGLPELLDIIDKQLANTPPKKDKGKPRLPIDRIFTISGSGTVVTGTLIDGSLSFGQEVEIIPGGLKSRLRGLQTHKTGVSTASPGSRVAANLTGITTTQLQRGDILTKPGWLIPTTLVNARLYMLKDAKHPLKHNAELSFYILAAEATAKIRYWI